MPVQRALPQIFLHVLTRKAEIKFTGFLTEHNLLIAAADHLNALVKECFPDAKSVQTDSCAKTKTFFILNQDIYPDLPQSVIEEMRQSLFSLSTDGSNNQNLEKMNPVTVQIYDVNQHKVVAKFLDMCLTKSSTSASIFSSIDLVLSKYEIPWSTCIALWVDNTSVNVGKHKSLIVEVRKWNENVILMGCPCHIAHNTAGKSTKAFCDHITEHFGFEEFSVDERTLKLYPSLKSYFLFQNMEIKNGKEKLTRLNRLIKSFSNKTQEVYLNLPHGALPKFIQLNLLLQ